MTEATVMLSKAELDPNSTKEPTRRLLSYNDDTFRAELGPRRVKPDGDGGFEKITPEEAAKIEAKFQTDWKKAIKADIAKNGAMPKNREARIAREHAVKPNKADYCFVDVRANHFPWSWKLYEYQETDDLVFEKDDDGNLVPVIDEETGEQMKFSRFVRVGQVDHEHEIAAHVPEVA